MRSTRHALLRLTKRRPSASSAPRRMLKLRTTSRPNIRLPNKATANINRNVEVKRRSKAYSTGARVE